MTDARREEWGIEHAIFHMLARRFRRTDVGHVYLAIQAGLAYGRKEVDAGNIIDLILPEGRMVMGPYCPNIGPEGLAFFHYLFVIGLVHEGRTDYHEYRFTRRYDGANIVAHIKTASAPRGPAFRERHDAMLKKLDRARDAIIAKHDWVRWDKLLERIMNSD